MLRLAPRPSPDGPAPRAGMVFASALLLLYTAIIAPVQLCLWDYADPCNTFPTLYWDVLVDAFFLV
jgi:hypothetical protein